MIISIIFWFKPLRTNIALEIQPFLSVYVPLVIVKVFMSLEVVSTKFALYLFILLLEYFMHIKHMLSQPSWIVKTAEANMAEIGIFV